MTRALPLLLTSALLVALAAPASAQDGDWDAEKVAGDLAFPVDLAFGPDGTLYYAELRTGQVRAIPPGADAPLPEPVASVKSSPGGNGGFLGLVLDPDFANTRAFFVYYSFEKEEAPNGKVNRVSRLTLDGEETVLVDDIPWAELHDGGRLVFTGPDTLVVTTGDNEKRDPAQDPDDLRGKTLRITRAGGPAPDNPDPDDIIYTLGHRNPFGIAYDPASGTVWVTENGPHTGDEVNILQPGGNYGWPKALGTSNDPRFVDPVVAFDKAIGPTGATVLDGALYFGDFNAGHLHRVVKTSDGSYAHDVVWEGPSTGAHALDVEAGPDGRLYYSTYSSIYAVTPEDWQPPAEQPPIDDGGGTAGGNGTGTPPVTPPTQDGSETDANATPPTAGTTPPPTLTNGTDEVPSTTPEENVQSADTPGPGMALVAAALLVAARVHRRRG